MSDSKYGAEVVERMKSVLELDSDTQLAKILGRAGSSVSNWRVRGNVPIDECIRFAQRYGVSLDWLILGNERPVEAEGSDAECSSIGTADSLPEGYTPIAMYDIEASAGAGHLPGAEAIECVMLFDTRQLEAEGLDPSQLMGARVRGDSMNNTLRNGDRVIIDRTHRTPDGVFLLRMGDELRIKRVQRVAGGALMLISDNPVYEREMLAPEDAANIEIIGRCCMRLGRID
ncbi:MULTISPECIES: LexA family transcriptional regulator [unclassified Zymobacter]|uniref:LexA family transcriptional regulator n=1 Tax=unclassified Zymobacter TaxID=3048685 RepID=UPI0039C30952